VQPPIASQCASVLALHAADRSLQRLRPVATAGPVATVARCKEERKGETAQRSAAERGEAEAMMIVARRSGEGFAHVPIVCV
jgi:hypothetical protein